MRRTLALIVVAAGLAAGCATPARIEQMAVGSTELSAVTASPALRENVAIKDVTGGKETNPMLLSNVNSPDFERALEASLRAAGMLAPRQAGRFQLLAHIEKLDQPWAGIDLTVTAHVKYTLVERSTGKDAFSKTIATPYTAKFSDSYLAVERLKLANEGAMRQNIRQLLLELNQAVR